MTNFIKYIINQKSQIINLLLQHIQLTFIAILFAIIIGIPLGILLSYLIYTAFNQGNTTFTFEIPWEGIIISILAVFVLVFIIMNYSLKKVNKQNIIESIRNENI